ncbi:MAG: DUF4234 domain-containing protein [Epulopiscium sp.]|nr:DUF4234 domain-containing protein [Candidatus Epulonipiscium sp.]
MIEERNVGLAIFFSVITCGIYSLYWLVKVTDEANSLSGEMGTSGGMVLLLSIVTCGLYTIYWNYKMGKKLYMAQERAGRHASDNSVLYLILSLFGLHIVVLAIIQSDINDLVRYV